MKKLFLFLIMIGMVGFAGCKKTEKMEEPAAETEMTTEGQSTEGSVEGTAAENTQQPSAETTQTE